MHCAVCHYYIGSHHSGNITCPQCRHVNHIRHEAAHHEPASHTPAHKSKNKKDLLHRHAKIFVASFGLIFISLLNLSANYSVSRAAQLDGQGNYKQAAGSLHQVAKVFVLPPISHRARAESLKNQTWLKFYSYQLQAEQYIQQAKYAEALALLQKISKDYPTYSEISADIAAAGQKLAAAPAVKPAAKPTDARKTAVNGPENAQNATKSAGCAAPSSIIGKRYVNTDEFGALASAASVDQIQQHLQNFLNQYGLNLEIQNVTASSQFISISSVSYDTVDDSDTCNLRAMAMILIDEWSKYPKDWIQNSSLQSIVLIKDMKRVFDGSTYPVSATYDTNDSQMWYDIGYGGDYIREAIHHEYYHLLVNRYTKTSSHDDAAWLADNPPGFSYSSGGAACYSPSSSCLTGEHPAPGFVTGYAASAIAEDQAEAYAYLMTGFYYHHLKSWLPADPLLAAKISLQETFIAAHSNSMDSSYFDSINP